MSLLLLALRIGEGEQICEQYCGIRVLETKKCGIHPEITVFVENREKLNKLIALLNQNCTYEVSIVKTRDSNICDFCGNYDSCPNIKKFFHGFFCK